MLGSKVGWEDCKVGWEKLLGTKSDGKICGCKVGWKDCWNQSWIGRFLVAKSDGKIARSKLG